MRVAVIGATGLVGTKILEILDERNFPINALYAVASERSVGKIIIFKGREYPVLSMAEAVALKPDFALFSAGGATSLSAAPLFAAVGTRVIDNSSAWRMDKTKKLIVPEVNATALEHQDRIIANPNCSTIQMVVALKPLHDAYRIKRIVVSTYQSVTGTGVKAVQQLLDERVGIAGAKAYPHPIDMNLIPQIDVFLDNGYSKEEMKMVLETQKIMGDDNIKVTATTVRVPVMGGHSESVNVEFHAEYDLANISKILADAPGVKVVDDLAALSYPMPLHAEGIDEVLVGRIRRDESQPRTLNLWIVADNLRKGAATNAIQIAEYIIAQGWVVG